MSGRLAGGTGRSKGLCYLSRKSSGRKRQGRRKRKGRGRRVTTNRGTRKEPETRGYPGERCFAGAKVRDCFKREGTKAGDECYPAAKHSKD